MFIGQYALELNGNESYTITIPGNAELMDVKILTFLLEKKKSNDLVKVFRKFTQNFWYNKLFWQQFSQLFVLFLIHGQ